MQENQNIQKMKRTLGVQKIGYILVVMLFLGCNNENAADCFQTTGDIIRQEVSVADFTKITVFENVSVVLKQGDNIQVTIETGANLINEVTAEVVDDRLVLRDTNDCNYVRDYGVTKVYITAPNITEIRSSTGFSIASDGVLTYPNLTLLSEAYNNPEADTTDGSFILEVDNNRVSIVANGISYYNLKGQTNEFSVVVAAGDSRTEASELQAQSVTVNHRGSNDILVNPIQSISGTIRGTGDVISYNRPETITVEELYKGELIFRE